MGRLARPALRQRLEELETEAKAVLVMLYGVDVMRQGADEGELEEAHMTSTASETPCRDAGWSKAYTQIRLLRRQARSWGILK